MKVFVRQSVNVNHKIISVPFNNKTTAKCIQIFIVLELTLLLMIATEVRAAPHAVVAVDNTTSVTLNHAVWPPMKHHDIWNDDKRYLRSANARETIYEDDDEMAVSTKQELYENIEFNSRQYLRNLVVNDIDNNNDSINFVEDSKRQSKGMFLCEICRVIIKLLLIVKLVIHLFPVPVDGECLSDDGRRTGTCFNAYECRNKGGEAKGECALGFGVCCIFIANCNETISNNITYLISPHFPSFMPNNVTNCSLKIKLMNDDISQLRIDFYHFILGQPNRRNGVCDGDVFSVSGGPGGTISLCGQNSGQHMYYDVGGRMLPRHTLYGSLKPLRYEDLYPGRNATNDTTMEIDIKLNFAPRFLPTRLWEIRITQIPFSQRAPAGCLQYFTGVEGVFQTFNFADNGRHLANQDYRICMRQEMDMCSIVYQPCDEQSFRIGPSTSQAMFSSLNDASVGAGGTQTLADNGANINGGNGMPPLQMQVLSDDATNAQAGVTMTTTFATSNTAQEAVSLMITTQSTINTASSTVSSSVSGNTTVAADLSTASSLADDTDGMSSSAATNPTTVASTTESTTVSTTPPALSDDVEGSGGEEGEDTRLRPTAASSSVSRRPRPTRGGFDLLGFLRSAFDFGFRSGKQVRPLSERQMRQFYSSCRDRITMPCIIEDFIGTGLGPLPGCEPIHCGTQFCSNGIWPCRIESTVTPFYVGIHFGDGTGKGSPEDNIGACLRYQQVQCM
ncbi:hypothetical protein CVS40_7126 [Lucilia cuprina]|nr:hypothetical protein CVS40_7126 [Lucilia cuprina]